jgi:arginine/lysine/ornithine decarboxylase
MLHVRGDLVVRAQLANALMLTQSTSPSYVLLSSLDTARRNLALNGEAVMARVTALIGAARAELASLPGLTVLGEKLGQKGTVLLSYKKGSGSERERCVFDYEPTRLVFSIDGVNGHKLFDLLRDEYGIEPEFADSRYAICIAGVGTKEEHVKALVAAARDIAEKQKGRIAGIAPQRQTDCGEEAPVQVRGDAARSQTQDEDDPVSVFHPGIPPAGMTPRDAWFAEKESVVWDKATGRVSGELITPYPPGIPVVCPGELITPAVWKYLDTLKKQGCHFHSGAAGHLDKVLVLRQ